MNNEEVREWFEIADSDFDSAQILNEAVRRHYEVICYHCAQAAEKYLKGYLVFNDILPEKTHDLVHLTKCCFLIDNDFQNLQTVCGFLNRFANDIRYPHKYEVTEGDTKHAINAVEKIRNSTPILDVRNAISNSDEE